MAQDVLYLFYCVVLHMCVTSVDLPECTYVVGQLYRRRSQDIDALQWTTRLALTDWCVDNKVNKTFLQRFISSAVMLISKALGYGTC